MAKKISRRSFIKQVVSGSVAFPLIMPRLNFAQSANGKLQHASIAVGGMGGADLNSLLATGKVDIVAICDVDENNLNQVAATLPNARKYKDWRELLAKEADKIDSVNVSTPDHMHAPIAMEAIKKGKHVYCQKPLAHEVYEARQLTLAAREAKVVTQMGTQIHSHIAYRMAVQMIKDGAIGKVKEWHSWSSAPIWPQGVALMRPEGADPVPAQLDWDLWIGVAPMRPYKTGHYAPFNWRGWQDFGGGAMGDFGCHIFDPVFTALNIGAPISVLAEIPAMNNETWPDWEIIHYEFPGTAMTAGKTIKATWYDGHKQPPRELAQMPADMPIPGSGSLIIGEEGVLLLPHINGPQLFPVEKFKDYPKPQLAQKHVDHYGQWVDACLNGGKGSTNFDYSGPMTEAVLLGNVANRFAGQTLEWDGPNMKITNLPEADQCLKRNYREGWKAI
jgi:predicted dehydrogenase